MTERNTPPTASIIRTICAPSSAAVFASNPYTAENLSKAAAVRAEGLFDRSVAGRAARRRV
jgi:hypothetical protein